MLNETSEEDQEIIRNFLWKKDPEKTSELLNSIQHLGQKEPSIITCDGFLINGNRRKMVMKHFRHSTKLELYLQMTMLLLNKLCKCSCLLKISFTRHIIQLLIKLVIRLKLKV